MDLMEICTEDIEKAHATLGLHPFAEEDEIRQAWRAKVRLSHPDHGGSADTFRSIQLAAEILLKEGAREFFEAESSRIAASGATTYTPSPPYGHKPPASEPEPPRTRAHRHPTLLAGAAFGYLVAPHLNQLGVTWSPIGIVSDLLRYLDSFFLIGWIFLKERIR